jgi:hypothetical protein
VPLHAILEVVNSAEAPPELFKKTNSPGKKILLDALAKSDWTSIFKELLFRIELYSQLKVLNYTGQDLNTIVALTRQFGLNVVVGNCVEKYTAPNVIEEPIIEPEKIFKEIPSESFDENSINNIVTQTITILVDEDIELTSGGYISWEEFIDNYDSDRNDLVQGNLEKLIRKTIKESDYRFYDLTDYVIQEITNQIQENIEGMIEQSQNEVDIEEIDPLEFYDDNKSDIKLIKPEIWEKLIEEFKITAEESQIDLMELFEYDEDGMSKFNSLNPTDFIIDICKLKNENAIEKILDLMQQFFEQYSPEEQD